MAIGLERGAVLGSAALAVAIAALAAITGDAAAQDRVQAGVAGAVVSPVEVSGPPRDAPVAAVSGMDMFLDDRIVTGAEARLQVILLDETVFTVGPSSDLVIDRFVYDPDVGTGEMAGQMTQGFLRYVSGQIGENQPENVTIGTPAGTIGIRGTALLIAEVRDQPGTYFCGVLGPGRDNNALARPGGCVVSNAKGTTEVLREGYGAYISAGQPPGPPVEIPGDLLAQLHTLLRPAVTAVAAEAGRIPANAAQAASANPVDLSLQGVAAQRDLAERQVELLTAEYQLLTDSGSTGRLENRPPSEIIEDLEMGEFDPIVSLDVPFFAQLTWDTVPDLDLHATGPNPDGIGRYHVFFADPVGPMGPGGAPVAELGDVTSSIELSEVITINSLGTGGVTRLSVFNFSDQALGSTSLSEQSNAMVSLLQNGLIERGPGGSFVIAGDLVDQIMAQLGGTGNTFVAFEIEPDGTVNPVGEFTDAANSVVVE